MKKNGFTFIEILGVITLLSLISVIVFIVVDKSLRDSKKTLGSVQIENIRSAASMWRTDHIELIPDDDYYEITLNTLINGGYIDSNIVNLNDENLFDPSIVIHIGLDAIFVGNDEFSNQLISREYVFGYTGSESVFDVPFSGKYKLEVWGAQGFSSSSVDTAGYGGYATGVINLNRGDILYINVGGQGVLRGGTDILSSTGGYNGGGKGQEEGGGATHIATSSGLLSTLENKLDDILIVAGGGGGSDYPQNDLRSGSGGGFKGGTANFKPGYGGTQQSGGSGYNSGSFGKGGDSSMNQTDSSSGGGGGFYGGGSGADESWSDGGGGSGYIGNSKLSAKFMYCYDCEESSETNIFTVSTTGSGSLKDSVGCPYGYSSNPISKCAKAENGYARITYLGESVD